MSLKKKENYELILFNWLKLICTENKISFLFNVYIALTLLMGKVIIKIASFASPYSHICVV